MGALMSGGSGSGGSRLSSAAGDGGSGSGSGSKMGGADTKAAIAKIRGYNELLDQYSLHQFIIRRGKVLHMTPEFQSFKRTHVAEWGQITTIVSV